MRNLRKLTAVVIAIALVLTSMTAVFAADTTTTTVVNGEKAQTLKDLGLYAGTNPDDATAGLDGALTTQDSLIFLAKLFGYNDAANKLTADEVAEALAKFDDASSISDYAKNVVAYSAINNILSGSTKDGKFFVGAKDTVTAARFATFILKQMGNTVADYKASVTQLAAIDGSKVSATLAGDLTRDDAVGVMYGTLTAKKADGTTVIAGIVGTDAAKKAIAEKAGLIAVEGLVKSVKAVTTTKVLVTLNKAVDAAASANFAIAGANVNSASLSNGTDVVLTTSILTPLKEYSLTVSGLKSNAVENASVTKTFVVPDINSLYAPKLTAEKTVLKADGASSTLVTFSLNDAQGNIVKDAQDVEVSFTATLGNFGEKRVSVQNGVATVMFTSEFQDSDKTAELVATVVEAKDTNLYGLKGTATIILSPNPDSVTETLGATLVAAEANQADRIILYFNKEVDVANYVFPSTANGNIKGRIDSSKAQVVVKANSKDGTEADAITVPVRGLLPVAGNKKAMQLLLDVETSWFNTLNDNDDVFVGFNDRTGTVDIVRTLTFKLTDARKPAMLSVDYEGLRKLKVAFSESIDSADAANLNNWSIDGILLSNPIWNGTTAATATVGEFDTEKGTDQRNVVTITLGKGKYFTTGAHSIQAANIGDWAIRTDLNNVMNTQTLDFDIPVDNSQPVATVEVQSPEQWLVTYNKDVYELEPQFQSALQLQKLDKASGLWVNDPLPLFVTKIDENKFLVETRDDWTVNHSTLTSLKNYFNFSYQLKIAKDAVTNVANGLKSAEQNLALGGAMLSPDTTSPVISDIKEVTAGTEYKAIMSEPVKLSGAANPENITLAQTQGPLQTVTATFIKKDYSKQIEGVVDTSAFIDAYDKEIKVTPKQALEAGDWILAIRSISDDVGNTAATVTRDFTVAGTVANTDFRILWAFADIDADMVVEDIDSTEAPDLLVGGVGYNLYDYVFVKFSKPVATSGDFKNALKTANYTLNGLPLPTGTQVISNIAGYDELDTVVDSVTIRLPQGTLQGWNSPNVLNVSSYIESTTPGEKLTNAGEKKLEFAVVETDLFSETVAAGVITRTQTQLAADLATRALVDNVKAKKDICLTSMSAINVANFVAAYNAAKASIDAPVVVTTDPVTRSYVKTQYQAAIDAYKAAVVADTDFLAVASATQAGDKKSATIGLSVLGTPVAPIASDTATTGFKVSSTNQYCLEVTGAVVTVKGNGSASISVTDVFWNVTKVLDITVVGGVITTVTPR